jgi:DNA-binding HxlR family transcriptional regulator
MKLDKVTNHPDSAPKRWYDDACGTALALEFVGERWSLLVMRELAYGPRRFGEIRAALPGISANVLTQRLQGLEDAGILTRRRLPSPANVQVYALTDWGRDTIPIMCAMGRWAARSPRHDPLAPMSAASAMMSLETLVDRDGMRDLSITAGFIFPDDRFVLALADGAMTIGRADPTGTDILFTGDTLALRHTIYGKRPLSREGTNQTLAIDGDLALAQRFVDLFSLPDKVA